MSTDASNPNSPRPKREVFDEYMSGDHALLHIDTARDGLFLPAHLLHQATVTLKLSYNFQGETIPSEEGVTSYLKFAGKYEECVIPWDAIWGMTSAQGEQTIWPESVPQQLLLELTKSKLLELGKRFFGIDKKQEGEAPESPPPQTPPKPTKSHLEKRATLKRIK